MTLTKRVIPCLDVADGRVVKGLHFKSIKDAGDPVLLAKKYSNEGADELVFLDITASEENREIIKSLVSIVKELEKNGFTEFLSTSINRDGTLQGPDLKWLSTLCGYKNVNVIASGGISNIGDVMSVKKLNPFGVILGKALYENQVTIEEAKGI